MEGLQLAVDAMEKGVDVESLLQQSAVAASKQFLGFLKRFASSELDVPADAVSQRVIASSLGKTLVNPRAV